MGGACAVVAAGAHPWLAADLGVAGEAQRHLVRTAQRDRLASLIPRFSTLGDGVEHFRARRKAGVWKTVQDALHRQVRVAEGRAPEPSAGALDSRW